MRAKPKAAGAVDSNRELSAADSAAVQTQLERILKSQTFVQSRRLARFLRFVVEQALNQKHQNCKEYVLGVEVFDRGAAFDPRVDPIVRVEARRLRAKLREYYRTEGRNDQLVIGFTKGSYIPQFQARRRRLPLNRQPLPSLLLSVGQIETDIAPLVERVLAEQRAVSITGAYSIAAGGKQAWEVRAEPAGGELAAVKLTLEPLPPWPFLQTAIAESQTELQAAYEQLRAANSELIASNQRLAETFRELQTALHQNEIAARNPEQRAAQLEAYNRELLARCRELEPCLAEMRRANDYLQAALASIPIGVAVVDATSQITVWNNAAEEITGLPRDRAVGSCLLELADYLPAEQLKQPLHECLAGAFSPKTLQLRLPASGEQVQCSFVRGRPAGHGIAAVLLLDRIKSSN